MKKKAYVKQFKLDAVSLAASVGNRLAAEQLGIKLSTLFSWIRKYGTRIDAKSETIESLKAENLKLKKDYAYVLKANDILKSAMGFLSQDQLR
jgi:transposase-like protein